MWSANKFINKISNILNAVSCASLAFLILIVTVNVIMRKILSSPIQGVYDYSGFLTTIIIGCGLSYCSIHDDHINLSLFVDKMKASMQKIIIFTGRSISFILLSIYTYSLIALAVRLMNAGEVSVTTKTPTCIFVYITAFCFLIFSLTVLLKLFPDSKGENKCQQN